MNAGSGFVGAVGGSEGATGGSPSTTNGSVTVTSDSVIATNGPVNATSWQAATPWQVAPRVWVLSGQQSLWRTTAPHPADSAGAVGMPAWRAREFLASRAALRHLLRAVLPGAAAARLRRGEHGEPRLDGHPDVGISLSHDGGSVAAAVASGRRVGVDIQHPPRRSTDRMLRRCLRERADQLAHLPARDRARELAWIWTVQEACVKAAGTGLAGRPWTIDVPPGDHRGRWRAYAWTSLRELSPVPLSCAVEETAADLPAPGPSTTDRRTTPPVTDPSGIAPPRTGPSRTTSHHTDPSRPDLEQPCPPVR